MPPEIGRRGNIFAIGFYDKALEALEKGLPANEIVEIEVKDDIAKLKFVADDKLEKTIKDINKKIDDQVNTLLKEREVK